jgi:hypothetical protein
MVWSQLLFSRLPKTAALHTELLLASLYTLTCPSKRRLGDVKHSDITSLLLITSAEVRYAKSIKGRSNAENVQTAYGRRLLRGIADVNKIIQL